MILYHNDHLGTPQKMTSKSGAVVWSAKYGSFGEATVDVATVENNLRFPGQYYNSETGLHYNYKRYYDSRVGKYLETDPIGFWGGNTNLYAYVFNSPIGWIDPWGLKAGDIYCTVADAAWAAIREIESKPEEDQHSEWGGWIIESGCGYSYTKPITQGNPLGVDPGHQPHPGASPYHTHGGDSAGGDHSSPKDRKFLRNELKDYPCVGCRRGYLGGSNRQKGSIGIYLGYPQEGEGADYLKFFDHDAPLKIDDPRCKKKCN